MVNIVVLLFAALFSITYANSANIQIEIQPLEPNDGLLNNLNNAERSINKDLHEAFRIFKKLHERVLAAITNKMSKTVASVNRYREYYERQLDELKQDAKLGNATIAECLHDEDALMDLHKNALCKIKNAYNETMTADSTLMCNFLNHINGFKPLLTQLKKDFHVCHINDITPECVVKVFFGSASNLLKAIVTLPKQISHIGNSVMSSEQNVETYATKYLMELKVEGHKIFNKIAKCVKKVILN